VKYLNEPLIREIQNKIEELKSIAKRENFSISFFIGDSIIRVHIINYVPSSVDMTKPTKVKTLFEESENFEDTYCITYSVITSENE